MTDVIFVSDREMLALCTLWQFWCLHCFTTPIAEAA